MGVCASCLGRESEQIEDDESSRLLLDDPHALHYGGFGDQNPSAIQADPQDVQRESEALQKIVAQTSNHLVDIFAMVPQNVQRSPASAFSGQDARLLQYRDVLAKLASGDDEDTSRQGGATLPGTVDWPSDEEDEDALEGYRVVKTEGGPLLGGFADVESK